jgi:hypothetical protein
MPSLDPDDSVHDSDGHILPLEKTTLLDVKLQVGGYASRLSFSAVEVVGIAAYDPDTVSNRMTAVRDEIEFGRSHLTAHRTAAGLAALFVLEDHDLERMTQFHPLLF